MNEFSKNLKHPLKQTRSQQCVKLYQKTTKLCGCLTDLEIIQQKTGTNYAVGG